MEIQIQVEKGQQYQQDPSTNEADLLYFNDGNQVDSAGNVLFSSESHLQNRNFEEEIQIPARQPDNEIEHAQIEPEQKQRTADLESAILMMENSPSAEMTPLLHQISTAHLLQFSEKAVKIVLRAASHRSECFEFLENF